MVNLKHRLVRLFPSISVVLVIVFAVLLVNWLKDWSSADSAPERKFVQKITMITPPPPLEEKLPEPEVEEQIEEPIEEMANDVPEESSEPVAGSELGLDADGNAGADSFGLVGKKGGRGLLDGGPFAWYAGVMEREITDLLTEQDLLKDDEYVIKVNLWVNLDGTISKIELQSSTGSKERDSKLYLALSSIQRFSQMPPGKMPLPVKLRITSSI